jgi:hypothetical protein
MLKIDNVLLSAIFGERSDLLAHGLGEPPRGSDPSQHDQTADGSKNSTCQGYGEHIHSPS